MFIFDSVVFFSFACILVSSTDICKGFWKNNEDAMQAESYGDGGLGYHLGNGDSLLCPVDTLMHNCFFHKSFVRDQTYQK